MVGLEGFSGVSLGVDQQVSLQVHLQAARPGPAPGGVGDQGEFVENPSAEIVGHHGEAVVGAPQLQARGRDHVTQGLLHL